MSHAAVSHYFVTEFKFILSSCKYSCILSILVLFRFFINFELFSAFHVGLFLVLGLTRGAPRCGDVLILSCDVVQISE